MDLTKVKKFFFFVKLTFQIINLNFLQMFVKALREMANPNGSSIQSVERHIRKVYSVEVDTGYMLEGKIQTKTSLKWLSDHKRSLACDFSLV